MGSVEGRRQTEEETVEKFIELLERGGCRVDLIDDTTIGVELPGGHRLIATIDDVDR